MDRRETERLVDAIRGTRTAGEPAALATVVRVRGSAYRREGTRMFVRRNRTYECALSGGCLEPTVADAAARVMATGEPVVVSFDLADDSIWGLGIGCSGAVDIRIEPIEHDAVTTAWLRELERGSAVVLVTPLSGASGRLLVSSDGETVGALAGPILQKDVVGRARELMGAPYPSSGPEWMAGAELFYDVSTPPPELVIFGAGHDAEPIARLAWTLGFAVTIVDARETLLTTDRFPGATLICAHPDGFADKVTLRPGSFVVVINHHIERDQATLQFSLASDAVYIGVLGPRARYEKLLAAIVEAGYQPDASQLSRVRSPVGLSLGAETPQEVAVSILGEILAIRRGFVGGFLSGSVESLHIPDAANRILARS